MDAVAMLKRKLHSVYLHSVHPAQRPMQQPASRQPAPVRHLIFRIRGQELGSRQCEVGVGDEGAGMREWKCRGHRCRRVRRKRRLARASPRQPDIHH